MENENSSTNPNQRVAFLRLKAKAGKLNPTERRELERAFVVIGDPSGGGLAIPAPCADVKEWKARYPNP